MNEKETLQMVIDFCEKKMKEKINEKGGENSTLNFAMTLMYVMSYTDVIAFCKEKINSKGEKNESE